MSRWKQRLIVGLCLVFVIPGTALATAIDPTISSTNYSITEDEIGGNGCPNQTVPACGASSNYKLDVGIDDGGSTLGEAATGSSSSTNYATGSGFNTTAQPGLMLVVNSSSIDLGFLSTASANTATTTFYVRDYTSSGYVVQAIGATPVSAGHNLAAMATNSQGDASQNGVEQFGINLVANTSPTTFGADPSCQAAGFCAGVAGDGVTGTYGSSRPYTVGGAAARYRYASGETIASGPSSSGETDYTMSFLANQSTLTPSGKYTGAISIVATGTF